jgi:hypothetical protein
MGALFLGMTYSEVVTSCLALIAVAISVWAYVANDRRAHADFRRAWLEHVFSWSTDAIGQMAIVTTKLHNVSRGDTENFIDQETKISELIDTARFIWENHSPEQFGPDKPKAYRGYRPLFLDYMVYTHDLCRKARSGFTAVEANRLEKEVINWRRRFVSEIQSIIDPAWFSKTAGAFSQPGDPRLIEKN